MDFQSISIFQLKDLQSKTEVSRALANMSTNAELQQHLIKEGVLNPIIADLHENELKCHRFAALTLTNLATDTSFYALMVEAGAKSSLVQTAANKDVVLEVCRYAVLGIVKLSASDTYHQAILETEALKILF